MRKLVSPTYNAENRFGGHLRRTLLGMGETSEKRVIGL